MILNMYMSAYTSWANDNPCFATWGAASANQSDFWSILTDSQHSVIATLESVSGSGGLLK